MSAFRYLVFAGGVVLVAVFGAVLLEFINPLMSMASEQASSQYATTGTTWMESIVDLIPLIGLALLVFGLLVGTIVRRNAPGVR